MNPTSSMRTALRSTLAYAALLLAGAAAACATADGEEPSSAPSPGAPSGADAASDGGVSTRPCRARPTVTPDRATCARTFGGRGFEAILGAGADDDGNMVVMGTFEGAVDIGGVPLAGGRHETLFFAKLDARCEVLWTRTFAAAAPSYIAVDPDGSTFVAGAGDIDFGVGVPVFWRDVDPFSVVKLRPDGTPLWKKVYAAKTVSGLAVDRCGHVVVGGTYMKEGPDFGAGALPPTAIAFTSNDGARNYETWGYVARLDGSGAPVFAKSFVKADPTFASDSAGNVVVAAGGELTKLAASNGAPVWSRPSAFAGSMLLDGADDIYSVRPSPDPVTKLSPTGDELWRSVAPPFPVTPLAFSGAVGVFGEVHLAGITDSLFQPKEESGKLYVSSLAADGSAVGLGIYGAPSYPPGIRLATGSRGEVLAFGAFAGPEIDVGAGAHANAYISSSDAFVVRNPSYGTHLHAPPDAGTPPAAPALDVLDDGPGTIVGLGAGSGAVTWARNTTTAGTISRCAATGCPPEGPTLMSGARLVEDFAVRGDRTYAVALASNALQLVRCSGETCTSEPVPLLRYVAAGADAILISTRPGIGATSGAVKACPLDGCAGGGTTIVAEAASVMASAPGPLGALPGFKCPPSGCGSLPPIAGFPPPWPGSESIVATQADAVRAMLIVDGRIYVIDGHRLASCPLSGCGSGASILASRIPAGGTINLASDGNDIYFFEGERPDLFTELVRLVKCPLAGCPPEGPTVLWTTAYAGALSSDRRVAVDGARIFFTAVRKDGTALVSMAK